MTLSVLGTVFMRVQREYDVHVLGTDHHPINWLSCIVNGPERQNFIDIKRMTKPDIGSFTNRNTHWMNRNVPHFARTRIVLHIGMKILRQCLKKCGNPEIPHPRINSAVYPKWLFINPVFNRPEPVSSCPIVVHRREAVALFATGHIHRWAGENIIVEKVISDASHY